MKLHPRGCQIKKWSARFNQNFANPMGEPTMSETNMGILYCYTQWIYKIVKSRPMNVIN